MPADPQQTVLDIASQQIAAVYAKAFLGAAQSAGKVDALVAELRSLVVDVLDKYPDLERLLGSAFLTEDEREGLIDRLFAAQGSPNLVVFLKVLSRHERLGILRAVHQQVQRLHDEMHGRIDITVTSAYPLEETLASEIVNRLRGMLGKEPRLNQRVDPHLVGGLTVRVGDTVFDGSVRSRLERLRNQMIDRTVEQIETSREKFIAE